MIDLTKGTHAEKTIDRIVAGPNSNLVVSINGAGVHIRPVGSSMEPLLVTWSEIYIDALERRARRSS